MQQEPETVKTSRRSLPSRYVVPHPAYTWFLGQMALGAAMVGLALGGFLWFYHHQLLTTLGDSGLIDAELGPLVAVHSSSFLRMSLVALLLFVVWMVLLSSFLFHRVAGPMYRLQRHLERVLSTGEGEEELRFRKSDRFHEVAELINRLLSRGVVRQSGE